MSRDSEPLRARWRRDRASAEDGSAVLEFLLVGVLVMCPLFYAVVSFARIQAGSYAVAQAARAASRYVDVVLGELHCSPEECVALVERAVAKRAGA